MLHAIGWVPLIPLFGFIILVFVKMSPRLAAWVGCGSVGLAALLVLQAAWRFFLAPPPAGHLVFHYGIWMSVGDFQPAFAVHLDALSLTMLGIITGVGFLIHVYSAGYMVDDPGYARYFAYLNLFVAAMSVLVLGDNLLLLFLGWEGVGICSYLLIGFWYKDVENGAAARKAFVVTRVGDTALMIAFFLLFWQFSTLDIQRILTAAQASPGDADGFYRLVCLLVLGGAVGKSAQLPLQTWLPDAMAGPTPVSALIHAATMVTAGVYLIARLHPLYLQSPVAMEAVAWVGLITLLLAGCSALVQVDIKRILAYSTISQIGYMFLGLGVGAWSASIFHLMTHAFFKALLFLSAGTLIFCLHHKQDIFEMGGLRRRMPLTFLSFLIGCGSLASLPFITSGFYSKDEILVGAYHSGHAVIFWGGVLGALLTAVYSFRLLFVVFFGPERTRPDKPPSRNMQIPLVLLGLLSLVGGAIHLPLQSVLPQGSHESAAGQGHLAITLLLALVPLAGVAIASGLYRAGKLGSAAWGQNATAPGWVNFWRQGWGFDACYQFLLVNPYVGLARLNIRDLVDTLYTAITRLLLWLYRQLSQTQTGNLRWFAGSMILGLILTLYSVVFA